MNKLQRLNAALSQFISKANRKNEPLESFRETESFQQFTGKISKGIGKQIKWTADNLDQIDFLQDEELKDSEFEAQLGQWLQNNMPAITEYVSQEKIYQYLNAAFVWSCIASYARIGVIQKSASINFELTNPHYIAALKDQANYLLHRSSMDETTRKRMITFIRDHRLSMGDINDLADALSIEFEGVNDTRAWLIANTETNQAMSTAQNAFLKENGIGTKVWIPAGPSTCAICQGNADQGPIPVDDSFESGDTHPPGHPGCECYEDAGEEIDLDSIPLWDGS